MIPFKHALYLFTIVTLLQYSCGKDSPTPTEEAPLSIPSGIQITTTNDKATIKGKADPGSEVIFQYAANNGQVLRTIRVDASGNFDFTIDRLVGYEQQLKAFASKADQTSEALILEKIPAKGDYTEGWIQAREHMQSHRWKSDQTASRTLIKQTASTPPYDMFATVAQKYFDFKADGIFHFEVSSPLQFKHQAGTWSIDNSGIITINTVIPLGAMQISNARIQHLDNNRLTLLAHIDDGLFLISMTKE